MGAILESLCRVQKIERDLYVIKSKEDAIRRQVNYAKRQVEDHRIAHEAHLKEVTRLQMEIDRIDLEIKSAEESVNKHRQALNAAKSNKEYAAILTALNTEKADSSKRESGMLELMSQLDALREKSKTFEQESEKLLERVKHHEKLLEAFQADNQEEIDQLKALRDQAAEQIPPSALATFNRIAARHEGEGLVEVVRTNPRSHEYKCSGCYMTMPLEQVNRLSSADEFQVCHSCGRILCLEGQFSTAGA